LYSESPGEEVGRIAQKILKKKEGSESLADFHPFSKKEKCKLCRKGESPAERTGAKVPHTTIKKKNTLQVGMKKWRPISVSQFSLWLLLSKEDRNRHSAVKAIKGPKKRKRNQKRGMILPRCWSTINGLHLFKRENVGGGGVESGRVSGREKKWQKGEFCKVKTLGFSTTTSGRGLIYKYWEAKFPMTVSGKKEGKGLTKKWSASRKRDAIPALRLSKRSFSSQRGGGPDTWIAGKKGLGRLSAEEKKTEIPSN